MSKKLMRILCLILSVILVLGLITGALVTIASAATSTHQLATLLKDGKIKPLGRTQVNTAGDGITANWSANGFEMNVSSNGGDFVIGYKTNATNSYIAVLVDGKQVWRGAIYGTGSVTVPLTAGKHTVSAIRENGHVNSTSSYIHFTTVTFDGTVENAPSQKSTYIEVIGDSYACGAGSAMPYEPGVQWGDADHTAQGAFGWYLSKMLGSDLSIVARGGIGLFDGTSEQEGTANTVTMRDIYPYASGHNKSDGEYSFARKPDLVVIELGANDGIDESDPAKTMNNWEAKLREMIQLVQEKNGADVKILLLSHTVSKYQRMMKIADEQDTVWSCFFSHHGNGAAALDTQLAGHPSADDEYEIAEALYKTIQDNDILGAQREAVPSYTDLVYYVSENGDDTNDGKTLATAMKTIKATMARVQEDNGGQTGFAAKTRIVLYVEGQVYHSTGAHPYMGGGQGFYETGTGVKAHKFIPVLITTYDYSGTPATILYDNAPTDEASASLRMVNNVYLKDIDVKSITNEATGYAVHRLFASNTELTIDNVSFTTDGKATKGSNQWSVYADHYNTGGFNPTNASWLPFYGTVTFKNGDYTNLERVAAVGSDSLTEGNTELPQVNCKLIIGEDAKMGKVYGAYGTMQVESATVEFRGGTVESYEATRSGTSSAKLTYNTDLTTTFAGGTLEQDAFYGTGSYINLTGNLTMNYEKGFYTGHCFAGLGTGTTLTGNLTNNISGGELRIVPVSTSTGNDGIYLGAYKSGKITGDLTNNISGGNIYLLYKSNVDSGIYLGSRAGTVKNLINNISGGTFALFQDGATAKSSGIYLGMYGGNILEAQYNNIKDGRFYSSGTGGGLNFGYRTIGNKIPKIVNVIGEKDSLQGPKFSSSLSLGGGWAFLGKDFGNRALTADDSQSIDDTVVLDTTIYSGYFGGIVYAGVNGSSYTDKNSGNTTHSYMAGHVKTDIYGGKFPEGFAGTSGAHIAGHVTTNIYGGYFTNIYGTRSATVYDGVETNIYGMTEYYPVKADNTWGIWAGGNTGKVYATSEGQTAVKLTINPKHNDDLVLNTPIYAGFASTGAVTGTTTVSISGGIYPKGLKVDGKTIGEVLSSGSAVHNYITGAKATYAATDASVSGHVEVVASGESATRELVYYVRPNGNNSNDGTRFVTAKNTIKAAIDQAVKDNGNSRVFPNGTKLVIYIDGTVKSGSGQCIGYGSLLTTADGKHMETVLTTYAYNGTKATIVQDHVPSDSGSSSICLYTDITLKDVTMVSRVTADGWVTQRVYASGSTLTLDNASLLTDNGVKWVVAADYFSLGGVHPLNTPETYGTIILKNGDYTNLSRIAAVNADGIWRSEAAGGTVRDVTGKHCKIIIEDGAKVDTVYGCYGLMGVESATVEIRGGEVNNCFGTSGSSAGTAKTYITRENNLIISGGKVNRVQRTGDAAVQITYAADGKTKTGVTARDLTINSKLSTTVSGGEVTTFVGSGTIKSDSYTDAEDKTHTVTAKVYLNGDITNTFSGGTVGSFTGTGASATVKANISTTVSGANVNNFNGTGNKANITGSVTQTFSGGNIGGAQFNGMADSTTLTGNMTNTFSGARLEINPTSTSNGGHGIFLAGRASVTINGNVTNNISAGSLGVLYKVTNIRSGIYMGLRGGWIKGDLTNNITGGEIYVRAENEKIVPGYAGIHTTGFSGAAVSGTVTNNITGGTFESVSGSYYFGQQGVSGSVNRVVNVIGDKNTGAGPSFLNKKSLRLAGGWGRVGVTDNSGDLPTDGVVDTVVVSNTIYGGTFTGDVIASLDAATGTNVTYIKGGVKTVIYGGEFTNFYANGHSPTYGHVTTEIHGGTFNSIYGSHSGMVHGNVKLDIYGMTEGEKPVGIWAAGTKSTVVGNVSLTIQPKAALTLSMPVSAGHSGAGNVTGTTSALVTGGTYTNGFSIAGLKVKDVLASGLVPVKDGDKTVVPVTDDMTTTGTDSVTLVSTKWTEESAKLTLSDSAVTYDGKTNAKVPTVTVKFFNTELVRGTDYTVSYSRDGAATTDLNSLGTVTVTAEAKAPYSGTVSTTYTITRAETVDAAIESVTDGVAGYKADSVTADDSAALTKLKSDINTILTDNAPVLTQQEKQSLNALISTVEALETKIKAANDAFTAVQTESGKYDAATVTADDTAALEKLAADIAAVPSGNLTRGQRDELAAVAGDVADLQKKIADTASQLAAVKSESEKYDTATVTADSTAKLTQLAADIAAISDGNLTAAQKSEKKAAADKVTALQKVISDTAAELAAVKAEVAGYSEDTVTESDATALSALATRIAAIPDGNLTSAQKAEKKAAADKVVALQRVIGDVTAELAAVKAEADKVDAATATADDSAALNALAERIAAISEAKLTSAQKAEKKAAADKIAAAQQAIADAASKLADAKAATADVDAATATADDSAALTAAKAKVDAVPDGNLTSAQKAEKKAIADKIAAAQQAIADAASKLADAKAATAGVDAATATADDSAALTAAKAKVDAVPDGNLTSAQKAEKKAAADKIAAAQQAIADAASKLAEAKTAADAFDAATVTADDSAALTAAKAEVTAVPDGNLTSAQKAEKKAAAAKVAAAQQAIADAASKLADAKTATAGVDAATATADDSAALTAAKAKVDAVPDANLTSAQKAEKQAAADKIAAAQQAIADAASKLADAKAATAGVDAATATADDSAALTAAKAKVDAVPDGNLTSAQKAEKQAAADKIAAAQQAIADAASKLADAKTAADAFDAATVTADDSAALTAAKAEVTAVPDGNLTSAQKAEKKAAADKIAAMEKVITDTAKALSDAKTEADKFDPNTVNSENTEALAAAAAQLAAIPDGNLTEAQKAEKKAAADAVAAMQKTVADTAADLEALKAAEKSFDPANLTAADKARLEQLLQELESYPADHLTGGEKELLEQLAATVTDKIEAIDKAAQLAGDIDAIAKLLEGKTVENVTSESNSDLMAARNAITELKKNTAMPDAEKQRLIELEEKLEALEEQLDKAEAATEIPASVQTVKPENVEPEDKTGLTAAIKALEDAEKNFASNYTAAEKQAIADTKAQLTAALAVIEEVETVQQAITQLPATAEPDDETAIAGLQAALDAFADLNDRQKSMVTAAQLDKLDKLGQSLRDYKIVKGDKASWTQASKKDLTFTVNGLFGKFEGVQVDGSTVDSKYYTVKSGSTIITLSDEFLDKLEKGEHTITAVYNDGKVTGSFTVKAKSASPSTGDETNIALLSLLAVCSLASAAALTIGIKKRKQ